MQGFWNAFRRPSPAMIIGCTALVIALGGTSYAVTRIPPDSVGRIEIREGAVGTRQVRDGSLRAVDLHKGTLPARPTTATRSLSGDAIPAGAIGQVSAACQPKEHAVGGGGGFAGPPTTNDRVAESIPVGDEKPQIRWRVTLFNGGIQPRTPVAYVICAAP